MVGGFSFKDFMQGKDKHGHFLKGNKIGPRFKKGNTPLNKGIIRLDYRGENHPLWKGNKAH